MYSGIKLQRDPVYTYHRQVMKVYEEGGFQQNIVYQYQTTARHQLQMFYVYENDHTQVMPIQADIRYEKGKGISDKSLVHPANVRVLRSLCIPNIKYGKRLKGEYQ